MKPLTDTEIAKKFHLKPKDKILDIGGSMKQHESLSIDTLVDIIRPEDAPFSPSPLKAKRFVYCDFTHDKLPFKDKEFDFCVCTHVLEDLANPFLIISEMERVSKRGYISTPSMGKDMVFSPIDYTNWLCGARRTPGDSHHKWFLLKKGKKLVFVPKNYPILYCNDFHFINWSGELETQYYWEKKITLEEVKDLTPHSLIDIYTDYANKNRDKLTVGSVLLYLDSPFNYVKALVKLMLKRGKGLNYRKVNKKY